MRRCIAIVPCLVAGAFLLPAAAGCLPGEESGPRTLILALDGMPYRVVEQARERGAFEGWPETQRLIAPFPSLTNVSFTVMFEPYGVGPARGYEYQHYDIERKKITGNSPVKYSERTFAWRDEFDVTGRTLSGKLAVYTIPWRKSRNELAETEAALIASPHDVVLAHVGSSDALQHLRGDEATVELMLQFAEWVEGLRKRHLEERGRPLDLVLLSDHGNTLAKVHGIKKFKKRLRKLDLNVAKQLDGPHDIVASTFGIVSYGALYVRPELAESVACAVAEHEHVELALWRAAPREVRVFSREGEATIRWRDIDGEREYAYESHGVDPLRYVDSVAAIDRAGGFDDDGFAADRDWMEQTLDAYYPDALHRIVQSLTGDHVVNRAQVLFSVSPGHSWGTRTALSFSWLRGGRIEGTHGGLDSASSMGFFLTNTGVRMPHGAVRADDALKLWSASRLATEACLEDERLAHWTSGDAGAGNASSQP